MNKCQNCNKPTSNSKYCNSSCFASCNNRARPKKKYFCNRCNNLIAIGYTRKVVCDECKSPIDNLTLAQLKQKHPKDFHSVLRDNSRRNFRRSKQSLVCCVCEYDIHVNICHIKPVKDFPDNTSMIYLI